VSNRSGAKWTAVAVVGVLIAVAAILAFVRERSVARPGSSTAAGSSTRNGSALSGASELPLEKTAVETSRAAEPSGTTDASLEKGCLRLAFVGDPEGAPVADLPFVVRQERGESKDLARGSSDAQGRAEVRDLDENVILVETPRHPPYAKKIEACWLEKGRMKNLVVHLDGGARVSGRVIDDLGKPVEGADLLLDSDLGFGKARKSAIEAESVTAHTGADGRFTLDHVADTPNGIWVIDGEERPERWIPAAIFVRKGPYAVNAQADVKPGDIVDIGDVIFARLAKAAGVVLDGEGRPVKGALVSARGDRFTAHEHDFHPSSMDAQLRPRIGESSTGDDGKFELDLGEPRTFLAVWTPYGQRQVFELPKLEPGERKDDLELRLEAITMLKVELVDEHGQRIKGAGPAARDRNLLVFGDRNFLGVPDRASIGLDLDDGSRETSGAVADADGLFRFDWKFPVSRARGVQLWMAGYEPFRARYESGVPSGSRLTCTLKETLPLRIRLRRSSPPPDGDAASLQPVQLWAQICLAAPEQRKRLREGGNELRCCGLGAGIHFEWRGEEHAFTFPASGGRPFWFYLVGFDRGLVDLASFGPFEPGEQVHDVEADPEKLRAGTDAIATRKAPTDVKGPGDGTKYGTISFRIVDGKSGEPVPRGSANGEATDDEAKKAPFGWAEADDSGRAMKRSFPAGSWTITFRGRGYRAMARTGVLVRAYEETDLGTVALDPTPGLRGRLLDADGEPVPAETWVQLRSRSATDPEELPEAATDEEGRFIVRGELPESPMLEVNENSQEHGFGHLAQRLPASGWGTDDEKVFRLGRWERVEVRLGGAAIDPPGSSLHISACPAVGGPTATCDHRGTIAPGHVPMLEGVEVVGDPAHRVYRFRMTPGRYQIFGTGLLHEVPVQNIEVKDSSDVQGFDLDSK
jgi:hypothetical protein